MVRRNIINRWYCVSPEAGVARIVNRRIVVGGDGRVQEVYMRRFENGHWDEAPSGLRWV